MARSSQRTAPVAALAVAGLLLWPAGARAVAPPEHAGDSGRSVAQVADYWTSQRMERATPLDVVAVDSASATAKDTARPASASVSFSSFELTDTAGFPNRVQGKVFFTRPGAGNYVCSGTAVDSGNRATVITAGHCLHADGLWSTNFAFAPGYGSRGSAPYGLWAASDETAPQPWVDSENLGYDVGAAVVARNAAGQLLEDVVGAREITFNQPTAQRFRAYGYPAQPTWGRPFDGTRLWGCDSAPPLWDNRGGSAPSTLGIGCDMTGGASGGGWVIGDPGAASWLNGVNSYKYSSAPHLMFGPYFGPVIQAMYAAASGQPAGGPSSPSAGNDGTSRASKVCRKARKRLAKKGTSRAKVAAKRACKAKR